MKKLLLAIFWFSGISAAAQSDSLLRTDGIYIFDNGLDTIIEAPEYLRQIAIQYNKDHNIPTDTSRLCGLNGIITTIGSTYLSGLVFFSDSAGRRASIGACRDEQNIRNYALMCLQREAIKDTTALGNNNVLYGMKLSADSSISFFYSKEESLMENYWGKAYGDSLVLEVRKASHPKHKTLNTVRNYKFFSYQEIFNCNWVYLKPNPIKLE